MSVQAFKRALMLSVVALLFYSPVSSYAVSIPLQDTKPSPGPRFERLMLAAKAQFLEYGNAERHITLDKFGVGSAIEAIFTAPSGGRVSVNLIDGAEENIILHVDARYNWYSSVDTLVLNSYKPGVGWGDEEYPSGYDFTPGSFVSIGIEAKEAHFIIYNSGREIGQYEHRQPLESVKIAQVVFEDNDAEQKAELLAVVVHYTSDLLTKN